MTERAAPRPLVVDSRWIGVGGTSRVCSQLIEGIAQIENADDVTLWGKPCEYLPSAKVVVSKMNPLGVKALFREPTLPSAQRYVFPHVLRPLAATNATVIVLDAIPLHVGSKVRRQIWRQIYKRSIDGAARLATISNFSRHEIADAVGIDAHRFTVVDLPVDSVFIEKLRAARFALNDSREKVAPYVVYFGQFNEHKNLKRLIRAFGGSTFASVGGQLRIVGGTDRAVVLLQQEVRDDLRDRVQIQGKLYENSLISLVAGARAVAFVSLEEGLGLPPVEAVLAGIPVVTSDREWSHEALPVTVPRCDPNSEESIQSAFDTAVEVSDEAMNLITEQLGKHRAGMTSEHFARQVLG